MNAFSVDQFLLAVIVISLLRLVFLVHDGVMFLAAMLELMDEDEPEIYHPPYEIEGDV